MSSKGLLYDYEVQMAHAMKGDIARRIHAVSEASSSNPKYDVFLSFRGLDTRKTFTDHLYWALKQEGYRTFRDDNEIERGENINSELQIAIRNSKMSVIVLSKNFADSTACLFELETILEHRKTSDHVILPVFYDVDPSEIKVQAAKLDFKNKAIKQVKVWSAALKEVASMAGMVSQNQSNGYEVSFIKEIVEFADRKVGDNQDLSTKWERLDKSLVYLSAQEEDIRAELHSQMLLMWKRPKTEVGVWLGDVASLKADVRRLEVAELQERRVRSRVQLGKILDEKIREVAELQERGRAFNDLLVDGDEWVARKERILEFLMGFLSEFTDESKLRDEDESKLRDNDELGDDDVWVAHTKRIREYLTDKLSKLGDGDVWVAHTERIREHMTDTLSEVGNDAMTERFLEYLMDTLPELRDDVATQTIREKLMDTLSGLGDGAVRVAHTERIWENVTDTLAELRDDAVTDLREYSKLGDGAVCVAHTERIWENVTDTLAELRDDAVIDLREYSKLGDGAVWVAHTERIRENLTDTLSELRDGAVTKLQEYSEFHVLVRWFQD